jgi:LuxR family maltose regulon positive regulatory protein
VSRFWPLPPVACYQARLWIAQGHLLAANRWAQDNDLNAADPLDRYLYEIDYLTLARLWIAQANLAGNLEAAGALLLRLHQAAASAGRSGSLIEILLLQAITFDAQKRREEALSALEQALDLAEPEGFVRIFLDEGEPMRGLLQASGPHIKGRSAEYAGKLLAAYPDEKSNIGLPTILQPSTLPERLSERELGVLRLIAEGASNLEISAHLVIAHPTVKRHISNIFNKLGVGSRTQAVAAGRKIGLL